MALPNTKSLEFGHPKEGVFNHLNSKTSVNTKGLEFAYLKQGVFVSFLPKSKARAYSIIIY